MRHPGLLLSSLFVLGACAPKMVSVQGSASQVYAEVKHAKRHSFTLQTTEGDKVDRARARNGRVVFDLEPDGPSRACLTVVDRKGKRLALRRSQSTFQNPAWAELAAAQWKATKAAGLIEQCQLVQRQASQAAEQAGRKLRRSPAYRNATCVTPRRGALPAKPQLACSPYEAEHFGTAMCLAATGGPEACGAAAKQLGRAVDVEVMSFLSSPACGMLVAEMLGQEYQLEHLLGDVALGLGEDAAVGLMREDDLLSNLAGLFIGGMVVATKLERFNSCKQSASQRCTAVYDDWRNDVAVVKGAPAKQREACESHVSWRDYGTALSNHAKQSRTSATLASTIAQAEAKKAAQARRRPLVPCGGLAPVTAIQPPVVTLIGIRGTDAGTYQLEGRSHNGGAKIEDVTKGFPAQAAGLRTGDVLIRANGVRLRGMDDVVKTIRAAQGKSVRLSYVRGGRTSAATLTPTSGHWLIGVNMEETTLGPRVTDVRSGTPAAAAGLRVGDIVLAADNAVVPDVTAMQQTTSRGQSMFLMLLRGKEIRYLRVTPELLRSDR